MFALAIAIPVSVAVTIPIRAASMQIAQAAPQGFNLALIRARLAFDQFQHLENFFHILECLAQIIDYLVHLLDGLLNRCRFLLRLSAPGFGAHRAFRPGRWAVSLRLAGALGLRFSFSLARPFLCAFALRFGLKLGLALTLSFSLAFVTGGF